MHHASTINLFPTVSSGPVAVPLSPPTFSREPSHSRSRSRSPHTPPRSARCTRSTTLQPKRVQKSGPTLLYDKADEAGAASDPIKQQQFLALMGLITPIAIDDSDSEVVITVEQASIIACANGHTEIPVMRREGISDGYYTMSSMNAALEQDGAMCSCPAHEFIKTAGSESAVSAVGQLIRIPCFPINNYLAKQCIINTINQIFYFTNLRQYFCMSQVQGTPFSVSFVLLDPDTDADTSASCSFAGWPDFITGKGTIGAEIALATVGEVESDKSDTVAQLGIYTIGQFQKMAKDSLAAVAVYKTKTAAIYLASLERDDTGRSVGTVSFRPVNSPKQYGLTDPVDVQCFAKILIGTLKHTESR